MSFPETFACAEKDGFQKLGHYYDVVTKHRNFYTKIDSSTTKNATVI